jgi:hypothetical protein
MIEVDPKFEGESIVDAFRQSIMRGSAINENAPKLLLRILRDEYWRRPDKHGKPFTHVEHFIAAAPLPGLGSDYETISQIVKNNPEALDALDEALGKTERNGGRLPNLTEPLYNVQGLAQAPTGNSRQASLRRLRKSRPDLHALVLSEELTCHQAMIRAGFRKSSITIPSEPVRAAKALLKHFTGSDLAILLAELAVGRDTNPGG